MTITLASLNSRIIIIIIYKKKRQSSGKVERAARNIFWPFLCRSMQMLQDILGLIFLYYSSEFLFCFFLFLALAISVVITHGVGETGSANGTPTDFPDRCAIFIIPAVYETKDGPAKDQPGISMCTRVQHSSQFNTSHDFYLFFRQTFYFFSLVVVSNSALWSNVIKSLKKETKQPTARPHAVKWINPLFSLFLFFL